MSLNTLVMTLILGMESKQRRLIAAGLDATPDQGRGVCLLFAPSDVVSPCPSQRLPKSPVFGTNASWHGVRGAKLHSCVRNGSPESHITGLSADFHESVNRFVVVPHSAASVTRTSGQDCSERGQHTTTLIMLAVNGRRSRARSQTIQASARHPSCAWPDPAAVGTDCSSKPRHDNAARQKKAQKKSKGPRISGHHRPLLMPCCAGSRKSQCVASRPRCASGIEGRP